MSSAFLACAALTLLTSTFEINETNFIDLNLTLNADIFQVLINKTYCPIIKIGKMEITMNYTGLYLIPLEKSVIKCSTEVFLGLEPPAYIANTTVELNPGDALVILRSPAINGTDDSQSYSPNSVNDSKFCLFQNATLVEHKLFPNITNLTIQSGNHTLPASLTDQFAKTANSLIKENLNSIYFELTSQFNNYTIIPPSPYPVYRSNVTPIEDWQLARAVRNIINRMPPLFDDALNLNAEFQNKAAIKINASLTRDFFFSNQYFLMRVLVPEIATMSISASFNDLSCNKDGTECQALKGISALNFITSGLPEYNVLNNEVGPLLIKGINYALNKYQSPGKPFVIKYHNVEVRNSPKTWFIVLFAILLIASAVGIVTYSAYRHIKKPLLDNKEEPVPLRRIVVEDTVVTGLCFICIYLFLWSNLTHAAKVVIGGEITEYAFSLINTVEDQWNSGLYPLAIFVFLFSAIYPYFKLIIIVLYCVILQRPNSLALRLVDLLGKFSLLDTFVMAMLKSALEIKGIADVQTLPSFYIFVVATLLSIVAGNYATNRWRHDTKLKPLYNENDLSDKIYYIEVETDSNTDTLMQKWYKLWEFKFALPFFLTVLACSIVNCVVSDTKIEISGMAVLITGSSYKLTFFELLNKCDGLVIVVGLFAVIIAPCLYILSFPVTDFLSSWCATDVFLLACIASLLQLTQYVDYVLGNNHKEGDTFNLNMKSFYTVKATLLWPLLLFLLSAFIQWFFIFKGFLSIRGMPTPKRIFHAVSIN